MKKLDLGCFEKLFETINRYEGKVELIIEDNICLNMKSTISQFVSMAYLLERSDISDIRINTSCIDVSEQMMSAIIGQ